MFKIGLHIKDYDLLQRIQSFFEVGKVTLDVENNTCTFQVHILEDLVKVILPHFDKYPLLSNKRSDFLLFQKIVLLMYNDKSHLSIEGLQRIVNLRASLNNGLSSVLSVAFPFSVAVPRPIVPEPKLIDKF